jgi:hypothetical protein
MDDTGQIDPLDQVTYAVAVALGIGQNINLHTDY